MCQLSLRLTAFVLIVVGASMSAHADNNPVLQGLDYQCPQPGVFVIIGKVVDEDPTGCQVFFDGILTGHSVTPESNGNFQYAVFLNENEMGDVTAEAEDAVGHYSNVGLTTLAW